MAGRRDQGQRPVAAQVELAADRLAVLSRSSGRRGGVAVELLDWAVAGEAAAPPDLARGLLGGERRSLAAQAKGSATRGQNGAARFVYGMAAKSGGMAPGVAT